MGKPNEAICRAGFWEEGGGRAAFGGGGGEWRLSGAGWQR